MKRTLVIILLSLISTVIFAQRFVYVDTDYILNQIPEYQGAQKQIDRIAETWRKEIDEQYAEIDDLYRAYQAEQVLMPEDMKLKKQQEIEAKEKLVKEFQKKRFGYQGDLFQKKQELIKPIQDKVYNEIQKMAAAKTLDFIFDKSSGLTMLFASPKYDKSDDILKALGHNPVTIKEIKK